MTRCSAPSRDWTARRSRPPPGSPAAACPAGSRSVGATPPPTMSRRPSPPAHKRPSAEVVGATYDARGVRANGRPPGWYGPGRFWSGDELELSGAARLGDEIEIEVPGPVRG